MTPFRQVIEVSGLLLKAKYTSTSRGRRLLAPRFEDWRAPLTVAAVFLSFFLVGCGAARPAKYYQLTIPKEAAADPPGDPLPVTILMGPIMSSHLYRDDPIAYSSSAQDMGTSEYQRRPAPPTQMI